jgi:DNA-binding MarR family transcriptional regulator
LVDQLEDMGHVEHRPDPTDRRAKLVYRTDTGKRAGDAAADAVLRIEQKLGEELGERTLKTIRRGLTDIITSRGESLPSLDR